MSLIIEKPRQYRRRALLITLVAMIIVYILWNVPDLRVVLYPLNLFVTYIHEAGHSLAALLTGGRSSVSSSAQMAAGSHGRSAATQR